MSARPQPVLREMAEASLRLFPRPELDLLLAFCSAGVCPASVLELAGQQCDWGSLIRLASHHGLVPTLYQGLAASGVAPSGALNELRASFDAHARQALWLTGELHRILDCLASRGIAALPYKGPALAELLYGNVTHRQFSDLDILVHRSDVPRAKETLRSLGYAAGLDLTPAEERAYLASGYEYTFDSVHGRNLVELQWQVLPRFYSVDFDMEAMFRRAATVSGGGREIRTLGTQDLLLVLCAHAAKHVWLQLSWLRDIADLARSREFNWESVHRQAQELGITRILAVTFFLAQQFFGAKLPPEAAKAFSADPRTAALGQEIAGIIVRGEEYSTVSPAYFRLMLRLRERRRDRARFLLRLAFTPSVSEWRATRLPAWLFPLYRMVRIARLIGRLGFSRPENEP